MSDSDDRDFLKVDPETAWLETITIGGFRIWHIIAICLGILLTLVVMVCCCIRFRIPRTKQEIEADYQRKQITKKFREKLQQIKNSDMDDMDLQKANVSYFNYTNNDIYSDTSVLVPPPEVRHHHYHHHHHHQRYAWQEHHQHSIVSLSIVEAGYNIALQHVAKEVITHQHSGGEDGCGGLLRQSHIVYPATTYRHKRESTQFFIENPMVHRVAQSNKSDMKNYRNSNEQTTRYQFVSDKYADFNNNNSTEELVVYDNQLNTLEDEHPVYGCNL